MRNPERIDPFLEKVGKLWKKYPDFRFGQLIYLIADEVGRDIHFPEEEEWNDALDRLIDSRE